MSNEKTDEIVELLSEYLTEHAKEEEHHPDCYAYRGKKASTGATSNAYRNGWELTFGRTQVGSA